MLILLISFIATKSKVDDMPSFELDMQNYRNINISTYSREGYYIPKDDYNIYYTPKKCSVANCNKYYGSSKSNIWTSCISPYVPVYNNKSVIKACQLPNKTEDKDLTKAKIKIETDKLEKIECDPGYYLLLIMKRFVKNVVLLIAIFVAERQIKIFVIHV